MMVNRNMVLSTLVACVFGATNIAAAQTSKFDFGRTETPDFHQAGWTIFEQLSNPATPLISVADPSTGWTTTFIGPGGSGTIAGGRDRDPFAATLGPAFTLDNVYIDFIVGWETLSINNLNPASTYDVQLIMFDDNATDGRTQSVFNVTDGLNELLGVGDGPGAGGAGASLASDLDFSVFGTGLSPDANGDMVFRFTNTATGDRSIINGLIVTQIPEPTSVTLIALAALFMHRRQRIRS